MEEKGWEEKKSLGLVLVDNSLLGNLRNGSTWKEDDKGANTPDSSIQTD